MESYTRMATAPAQSSEGPAQSGSVDMLPHDDEAAMQDTSSSGRAAPAPSTSAGISAAQPNGAWGWGRSRSGSGPAGQPTLSGKLGLSHRLEGQGWCGVMLDFLASGSRTSWAGLL